MSDKYAHGSRSAEPAVLGFGVTSPFIKLLKARTGSVPQMGYTCNPFFYAVYCASKKEE